MILQIRQSVIKFTYYLTMFKVDSFLKRYSKVGKPLPKLSTLLVNYFCNQSVLQISNIKYTFSRLEV